MIGLVADGDLYLKLDDTNRAEFEALNFPSFRYAMKDGGISPMSHHRCPEPSRLVRRFFSHMRKRQKGQVARLRDHGI